MRHLAFLFSLLITGVYADIDGSYLSEGWSPYMKSNFAGNFRIDKPKNGVYQSEWTLGNLIFKGTGMRTDDQVCFVSVRSSKVKGEEPEVILSIYNINDDKLIGAWVDLGESLIGTDILTKKD